MPLPVDIRDLMKSGTQIREQREKPVRVAVFVEMDAPDTLIDKVREAFRAYTANAVLQVEVAEPDIQLMVDPAVDAVVALAGSGRAGLAEQLVAARDRAIPTALLALDQEAEDVAVAFDHPFRDTLASPDVDILVEEMLGEWLVESVAGKRLAFAANYEFMRRAVAVESVKNTAWQNGLVGVVAIIPGTDMPIMTANQAKMVLQIAAAYGEELGIERARELFGVVGGAFAFRTVARQLVGLVPGFGWAIKGGIGASGTLAMGYAAIKYFENDGDMGRLTEQFDRMKAGIKSRLHSVDRDGAPEIAYAPASEVHELPTGASSAEGISSSDA